MTTSDRLPATTDANLHALPFPSAHDQPAILSLAWVVVLLLVSIGLPLWHRYGMDEVLRFDSSSRYQWVSSYDDRGLGGQSIATLERNRDAIVLHCQIKQGYAWPYCSFSAIVAKGSDGFDLSRFQTASFDITATGPMQVPVRIYLRNFDPAYSKPNDTPSLKVNTLEYVPHNDAEPFVIPLANFQVASWWLQQYHIPIQQAAPDLHDVTVFDISTGDGLVPGDYEVRIHSIAFHGKWLSEVQLLSIILALWFVSAATYLVNSLLSLRRSARANAAHSRVLEGVNAALKLEREELATAASHDALTGVLNRVGLRNRLYQLMASPRGADAVLCVLFIDIDHFKRVNDNYGHATGDAVLQHFAATLARHTRGTDVLCRWGGEEFVLLCDGLARERAGVLALNICSIMAGEQWPEAIPVRCSLGVAQTTDSAEAISAVLERADQALYAAKQGGRHCVGVDTPQGIVILRPTQADQPQAAAPVQPA